LVWALAVTDTGFCVAETLGVVSGSESGKTMADTPRVRLAEDARGAKTATTTVSVAAAAIAAGARSAINAIPSLIFHIRAPILR
jgi:hypothetical protein